MKICVLTSGHTPDDDRVYYKEICSLLLEYTEIHLAAPGTIDGFSSLDDRVKAVPLGGGSGLLERLLMIPRAIRAMIALKPDVIHFHDYELILAIPFFRLFTSARLIYDVHEMYPDMIRLSGKVPGWLKPFAAFTVCHLERALARLCHLLITSDQAIADSLQNCGVPIEVIFNYPRLELFKADLARVAEIRQKRNNRPLLIYQGSMGIDRGLFQIVESMVEIRRHHQNALLILVGNISPDLKKGVAELVSRHGLEDHVDVTGWVAHQDIVNWVAASTVGLVPFLPVDKYKKNIPIKQFEYMACGLAIVAADLPPISQFVGAARCGRLYTSGNQTELTRAVIEVLDSEETRETMAQAGLKAVQNRWNWNAMEEQLLKAYQKLIVN